jgi:DNA-binding NarL/FixJ family response regulator
MITVSLVEDNRKTRESLAALLRNSPGFSCLSVYGSGEDALRDAPIQKPQVILMDINLPGMNGIECVGKLKAAAPEIEILMLTAYEDTEQIFSSLQAGASGYLLKSMPPQEILAALTQIVQGGAPMSASIARKVVTFFKKLPQPAPEMKTLTARESEILGLLAKGYHYKEIASALEIGVGTVRTHLHAIYKKLQVQSRTEAVVKYLGR